MKILFILVSIHQCSTSLYKYQVYNEPTANYGMVMIRYSLKGAFSLNNQQISVADALSLIFYSFKRKKRSEKLNIENELRRIVYKGVTYDVYYTAEVHLIPTFLNISINPDYNEDNVYSVLQSGEKLYYEMLNNKNRLKFNKKLKLYFTEDELADEIDFKIIEPEVKGEKIDIYDYNRESKDLIDELFLETDKTHENRISFWKIQEKFKRKEITLERFMDFLRKEHVEASGDNIKLEEANENIETPMIVKPTTQLTLPNGDKDDIKDCSEDEGKEEKEEESKHVGYKDKGTCNGEIKTAEKEELYDDKNRNSNLNQQKVKVTENGKRKSKNGMVVALFILGMAGLIIITSGVIIWYKYKKLN